MQKYKVIKEHKHFEVGNVVEIETAIEGAPLVSKTYGSKTIKVTAKIFRDGKQYNGFVHNYNPTMLKELMDCLQKIE